MATAEPRYVPALGFNWLTWLYDPLLSATLREQEFKSALVRQATIAPGHRVLDLGAGTGTLTLLLKQVEPQAEVSGVDGDPEILERARRKAAEAGSPITFTEGMAHALPYPDASFDRVVTSLLLHHLANSEKKRALAEVWRVLRPGGELHVADWGKAQNFLMRVLFLGIQLLDGFESTGDNAAGRLPDMFREGGFVDVCETASYATLFGTLTLWQARKPAAAAINGGSRNR
jgi:SAM-dependent methyltransferase